MLGRAPGAVPCGHCKHGTGEHPCPHCGLTICEACARADDCAEPRAIRYQLGRRHRVTEIAPDGAMALVRRRGKPWRFDLRDGTWELAGATKGRNEPHTWLGGGHWLVAGARRVDESEFPRSELQLIDVETGEVASSRVLPARARARALTASPGGRWVTAICDDETVQLIAVYPSRGAVSVVRYGLRPAPGEVTAGAHFDPVAQLLIVGTYGRVDCHRVRDDELEHRNSLRLPDRSIESMAFGGQRALALLRGGRGDGWQVVTFEIDRTADRLVGPPRVLWDQNGETGLGGGRGPERPVVMDLAADGRRGLLALDGGHLLVFDVETGLVRRLLDHRADITAARLTPDGAALISADATGDVIVRPIHDGRVVTETRRDRPRKAAGPEPDGAARCPHCERVGTWSRCPSCERPVCIQCARDWRGCPATAGLELDLPWGARIQAIERGGRRAAVSRWLTGDRIVDLHQVSWMAMRGPWSLRRRVGRALTRSGRYLRFDGAILSMQSIDGDAAAPLEVRGDPHSLRLSTGESGVSILDAGDVILQPFDGGAARRIELPQPAEVALWDEEAGVLYAGCGDALVRVRSDGSGTVARPLPGRCAWLGRCADHLVVVVDPADEAPLVIALVVAEDPMRAITSMRCQPDLAVPATADASPARPLAALTLVDGGIALFDPATGVAETVPAGGGRVTRVRLLDDGSLAVATADGRLRIHRWQDRQRVARLATMRVSGTLHR